MNATSVHQALYGYDDGHRLISASLGFDKESGRLLRSVTDMRFRPPSTSYLTILPLPSVEHHAFIRSWPADADSRLGSVWSHVVFCDHQQLRSLTAFGWIADLFRRPPSTMSIDDLRIEYGQKLAANAQSRDESRQFPSSVALKVVSSFYMPTSSHEVVVSRVDQYEPMLFALLAQLWPDARPQAAFRTRHRSSPETGRTFAFELVERASRRAPEPSAAFPEWVSTLANDLVTPNATLRTWLERFAPPPPNLKAVSPLVRLFATVERGDVDAAVELIGELYPNPNDMSDLKATILGRSEPSTPIGLWPTSETRRVQAALRVEPTALNYETLQIDSRIKSQAAHDPAFIGSTIDERSGDIPVPVLRLLGRYASASDVSVIASRKPETAKSLVADRPDLYALPDLWHNGPLLFEMMTNLLLSSDDHIRTSTFVSLVRAGEAEAARAVCNQRTETWWSLLAEEIAPLVLSNPRAVDAMSIAIPDNAREEIWQRTSRLGTEEQIVLFFSTVEPGPMDRFHGSFHKVTAAARLVHTGVLAPDLTEAQRIIVYAAGLAAALIEAEPQSQIDAFRIAFGPLHAHLAHYGSTSPLTPILNPTLPKPNDWDWCARLRRALVYAANAARLPTDELKAIAGEAAGDVLRRQEELQRKEERRSEDDQHPPFSWFKKWL